MEVTTTEQQQPNLSALAEQAISGVVAAQPAEGALPPTAQADPQNGTAPTTEAVQPAAQDQPATEQAPEFSDPDGVFSIAKKAAQAPISQEPTEMDKTLAERFAGRGINSVSDLDAALSEREALKKRLEESSSAIPKLNEAQQKLFDLLKDSYDGTNLGALRAYADLVDLKPDALSSYDAMKEAFVMDNKHLSREDAEKAFAYRYEDEYETKGLDPTLDSRDIEKRQFKEKVDAHTARTKLAEVVRNAKPPVVEKAQPAQPTSDPTIERAVANHVSGVPEFISKFPKTQDGTETILDFAYGDNKTIKIGIDKGQKQALEVAVKKYMSDPNNYDANGALANGLTPQDVIRGMGDIMFQKEKAEALYNQGYYAALKMVQEKQKTKIPGSEQVQMPAAAPSLKLGELAENAIKSKTN